MVKIERANKKIQLNVGFFYLLRLLTKAQSYTNLFDKIASFLLNNLVNFTSRKQTTHDEQTKLQSNRRST